MQSLIIVESPAKSKTLTKYLGKDFIVLSSFGHVRSLPSKPGSVDPENDFSMKYEIISEKHSNALIKAASKVNVIYLAPDPDREGEAIAWHVAEVIKDFTEAKIHRITFNEITKTAVKKSLLSPRKIDMDLVNAQQARQGLDYLVGFTLSPVLWRKVPGSKSAGRVQSVALKLICQKEIEIKEFIKKEYWSITGCFGPQDTKLDFVLEAELISVDSKKLDKFHFDNESKTKQTSNELDKLAYLVTSITKKKITRKPLPPLITSTLQQEASNKLNFSAKKTMMIAQKLYEGIDISSDTVGLITYMRTDGLYVSDEAIEETRKFIQGNFGSEYVADKPIRYQNKVKNAQEAHEAIRPTSALRTPNAVKEFLTQDELKLYTLIWNRMIASQMSNAILEQLTIIISDQSLFYSFKATGSVVKFHGFYKVSDQITKDKLLPELNKGDAVVLNKIKNEQHFTQPTPRYTEASLVKKMEELGIGRPSTYATIISVLQTREYVKLENRKFIPEDKGIIVNVFLMQFFDQYVKYDFTANLEQQLDSIAVGEITWKHFLQNFWSEFNQKILETSKITTKQVIENITNSLHKYVVSKEEGFLCPDCKKADLTINVTKVGILNRCGECGYRSDKKVIFVDESGNEVLLKQGPYGRYIEANDKRYSIPAKIEMVDEDMAKKIMKLPIILGTHPVTNLEIKAGIGAYGAYIAHNKVYHSINSIDRIFEISLEEAIKIADTPKKTRKKSN